MKCARENGAVLEALDLSKSYVSPHKSVRVIDGLSFSLAKGETVAVTGKSGSGKSTLLNLLGGIDSPDGGQVRLNGKDIFAMAEKKRARLRCESVGYVFQAYHLLPEMTVLENVMLPAMALGKLSRGMMRKRAEELLEMAGMLHRREHLPSELSGGEQQRAAIARALVNGPELVLADEPTGNLDEATGREIFALMARLVSSIGGAMLVVTHDMSLAGRCDRVLRLEEGRLVQV